MPDQHKQADRMRQDVPATIARSGDKAVRTFKKALESAEKTYGSGGRARRAAFAALKHTHEKVGDHWEPKQNAGSSDSRAERGTSDAGGQQTASGVDANASKRHLNAVAKRLGIERPQHMNKADLVTAIEKANARATRKARER